MSGGQEGDQGYFELASGEKIPVLDTTFDENKAILHHLETVPATLKKIPGDITQSHRRLGSSL